MKSVLFAIVFGIATGPMPAEAAWQYTKWNMTPQQVIKASKGIARPGNAQDMKDHSADDGSEAVKLEAPYNSGSFLFTAYFSFDRQDCLVGVSLKLERGNPHEVVGALHSRYGKPENHLPDGTLEAWRWDTATDRISAILIGGEFLNVNYSPRHSSNESGL